MQMTHMNSRWIYLMMPLVLACLAWPRLAPASPPCQCAQDWTLPRRNSVDVPLNARLMVFYPGVSKGQITLVETSTKAAVSVTVTAADSQGWGYWISPAVPLKPSTGYTLNYGKGSAAFSSGKASDTSPPALSSFSIGSGSAGACGDHITARAKIHGYKDDATLIHNAVARLTVTDPGGRKDTVYANIDSLDAGLEGGFLFGSSTSWPDCFPSYFGANSEGNFRATLEVLDLAGHVSAPSAEISFTFAEVSMGGCAVGHGGVPAGPAMLYLSGLLVLLLRRTRLKPA